MEQYFESLKSYITDKVSSPFLPAYTLSWSVFNYKFFIYLFSNVEPRRKISGISNVLQHGYLPGYCEAFIVPLIMAGAYVFGYPYVARWVMIYSENQKKKTKQKFINITEDSPRTAKEFHDLHDFYRKRTSELIEEASRLETRLDTYKNANRELELQIREKLKEETTIKEEKRRVSAELLSRETDISTLRAKVNQLSAANSLITDAVEAANSQLASEQAQTRELKVKLDDHKNRISDTYKKIGAQEAEIAHLKSALNESENKVSDLIQELSLRNAALNGWVKAKRFPQS